MMNKSNRTESGKNTIFIIGAGRSGTNILRDSICRLEGFQTWPCDEINYIWRHGNINKPTDRFTEKDARSRVKNYLRNEFKKFRSLSQANYVVEKTCANTLKIPFINSIFPDAKYIYIIRDGKDVASSAKKRWTASLELKYIMKKVKYVPLSDIPYYGFRYLTNRIKKIFSKENRLAFWGPIYPGMMADLKKNSLIEVCAKQWKNCTEQAYNDLCKLDVKDVHFMKYESFTANPSVELKRIMKFLKVSITEEDLNYAVKKVSAKSVGNYQKYLKDEELNSLNEIVNPVMLEVYNKI